MSTEDIASTASAASAIDPTAVAAADPTAVAAADPTALAVDPTAIVDTATNASSSIDFGTMSIGRLFGRLFVPTLMGLVFMALLNIADGIIVGQGVGSDALAAVNIAAPIYLLSSGVALMFAAGVSVVASIHMARGNVAAANANITQALLVPMLFMALLTAVILLFPEALCRLFGGSERLQPAVVTYLRGVSLVPVLTVIDYVGTFVLRLDGAPRVAMWVNIVVSVLNIALDWLLVFPLHWGILGAAVATTASMAVGALITMAYLLFFARTVRLLPPRLTAATLRLTRRNISHMARLGLSTFIAEAAIAGMMVVGNYMFIHRLHEDGVAAFSVACYLFPLVFMFGNAIAQAQLPIISYNYGQNNAARVSRTIRLALLYALLLGLLMSAACILICQPLLQLFLTPGTTAYRIAADGFPLFSIGFLFFTLNITAIGYYQSVERALEAIAFMSLRGLIFVVPCFTLLPLALGNAGLWLAVPLSEALTAAAIALLALRQRGAHARQ